MKKIFVNSKDHDNRLIFAFYLSTVVSKFYSYFSEIMGTK
jgi:hypothetical protein